MLLPLLGPAPRDVSVRLGWLAGRAELVGGQHSRTCSCPVHSCLRAPIADDLTLPPASPPPQHLSGDGTRTGVAAQRSNVGRLFCFAGVTTLPRTMGRPMNQPCVPAHAAVLPAYPPPPAHFVLPAAHSWAAASGVCSHARLRQQAVLANRCRSRPSSSQLATVRRWGMPWRAAQSEHCR